MQSLIIFKGIRWITAEKSERGHAGPKPVTGKCCRALLPPKVDVNIALREIRSLF